jgi:hypothetical protein
MKCSSPLTQRSLDLDCLLLFCAVFAGSFALGNAADGLVVASLLPFAVLVESFLRSAAPAAASGIVVVAEVVADLAAASAASKLASLPEAGIEVDADEAFVELEPVEPLFAAQGAGPCGVLHEAEATGRFAVAVEAHDDALQRPGLAEEGVQLLLGGVEGEVSHVERGAACEVAHELVDAAFVLPIDVIRGRCQVVDEPGKQRPGQLCGCHYCSEARAVELAVSWFIGCVRGERAWRDVRLVWCSVWPSPLLGIRLASVSLSLSLSPFAHISAPSLLSNR